MDFTDVSTRMLIALDFVFTHSAVALADSLLVLVPHDVMLMHDRVRDLLEWRANGGDGDAVAWSEGRVK